MVQNTSFNPDWYSPPGSTINEILQEKNISIFAFAESIDNSTDFISRLFDGKVSIDYNLAEKLSFTLGASVDFWVNREQQYRESLANLNSKSEKKWLKMLPIKDLTKLGWINKSKNLLNECLTFFDVNSIEEWENTYKSKVGQLSFRTSSSYQSDFASVATWLRKGEIIASKIECKPWNKELFESKIDEIKKLTRVKSPSLFIPKLIDICSECGVALSIVKTPEGCKASGATRFISENKALMMLSFRYLSDDHFWFTFFHEAGHLILHDDSSTIFVEMSNKADALHDDKEREANLFAAETLIPYTRHSELKNLRSNKRKIITFARELDISPGIVIGQMQFLGFIKHQYLNSYKRRYNWVDINKLN